MKSVKQSVIHISLPLLRSWRRRTESGAASEELAGSPVSCEEQTGLSGGTRLPRPSVADGDWVLGARTHRHTTHRHTTHREADKPHSLPGAKKERKKEVACFFLAFLFPQPPTVGQSNVRSYLFWYSVSHYFIPRAPPLKRRSLWWKSIHGFNGFLFPFSSGSVRCVQTPAAHFRTHWLPRTAFLSASKE